MGGSMSKWMGPVSLVAGIGATAMGQPELGLPLMAGGFGSTVGDLAGGKQGAMIGGTAGGLAGLGMGELAPGVGTSLSNMMGQGASQIPGAGNFLAGQGNVGAALASNPATAGIDPSMVAGGAAAGGGGGLAKLAQLSPLLKAFGMGGQQQQPQSPMAMQSQPMSPPPPQSPPIAGLPSPQPAPPSPVQDQLAMLPPQLKAALGLP